LLNWTIQRPEKWKLKTAFSPEFSLSWRNRATYRSEILKNTLFELPFNKENWFQANRTPIFFKKKNKIHGLERPPLFQPGFEPLTSERQRFRYARSPYPFGYRATVSRGEKFDVLRTSVEEYNLE